MVESNGSCFLNDFKKYFPNNEITPDHEEHFKKAVHNHENEANQADFINLIDQI
jgi:hypothetical protein